MSNQPFTPVIAAGATRRVVARISGMSALIMNRFHEGNEAQVSTGTSSALRIGNKGSPRDQANLKAYLTPEDFQLDDGTPAPSVLYLPGPNIFKCLIEAGSFHKAGRSKITTAKSSLIPACVEFNQEICVLHDQDGKPLTTFEVDSRPITIPATGGRIMAHRPKIEDWHCTFEMVVDESMIDLKLMQQILADAGRKVGIGDFRPSRKGPYGRFALTSWEIKKESLPAAHAERDTTPRSRKAA